MATLTEKQEAVKEILGSTDSIRDFVQDKKINLEELKGYLNKIQSVIKEEEDKEKIKLDKEIETTLSILRAKLINLGYKSDEADKKLGKSPSDSDPNKDKGESKPSPVRYKFSWVKQDGTPSEKERGVQGQIKDEDMKAYMDDKGYFSIDEKTQKKTYSLQKWVSTEGLRPV
ncbi:hypothetical protein [Aeromonas media]|uniref:hypothetical protein n=1 Tax=Aeromonas media TaxID=651 RepID=UPI003D1A7B05